MKMKQVVRCVMAGTMLSALLVGGCASPFEPSTTDHWETSWLDGDPSAWRYRDGGTVHQSHSLRLQQEISDALNVEEDPGPEGYVTIALNNHPAIKAAEQRVARLRQQIPQVTSLDDPMLQVTPVGDMAETASGQVGLMSGVSQKLPYPGKLKTRGRIVQQEVAVAERELKKTRIETAAQVRRAYWSYYYASRAVRVTRESRRLLDQFRQVAEAEYRAGRRSQPDVLRASVELGNVDAELAVLEQRKSTARSMLNRLLDRPIDASLPEPALSSPVQFDESVDAILTWAAERNPDILKWYDRIEQARQRLALAKLNRRPDLTVSATYNVVDSGGLSPVANGDDQWWLGFGINLPIWSAKLDAAEREAFRSLSESVARLGDERNRVAFQVQDAYLRVKAQWDVMVLLKDQVVPQARQTVEASSSGYRAGAVDFLTLVDNWRKQLSFELLYHRATADMQQALADLALAAGVESLPGPGDAQVVPAVEQNHE
ncbi:MAG: TolC family protein [Phycisphaeraceae bacterium]